jgi:cytochrome bd-type quinol oxidase subunit 2
MTVVAAVLFPLVLAYQAWAYFLLRRRVSGEPTDPDARRPGEATS